MIHEAKLPEHVKLLAICSDGTPVYLCAAPRHKLERTYAGREGERVAQCPLCLALEMGEAERPPEGDAAPPAASQGPEAA